LGDIIELWQASVTDILQDLYEVLYDLISIKADKVYVSGNHDRITTRLKLINDVSGTLYVEPDFIILQTKKGKKIMLIHGHQFDKLFSITLGLWRIQSYIYSLSEALLSFPGPSEWYLAGLSAIAGLLLMFISLFTPFSGILNYVKPLMFYASLSLEIPLLILLWRRVQQKLWYVYAIPLSAIFSSTLSKNASIEDVIIKNRLVRDWALKIAEEGVSGLVFGHTHNAGMTIFNNVVITNTGCWITESTNQQNLINTFVIINNESISLYKWDQGKIKLVKREVIR
ncbi:MAG: hypothetical protein DRP08_04030, partial [Candidatus Aenigmatarchaeota archaeon]